MNPVKFHVTLHKKHEKQMNFNVLRFTLLTGKPQIVTCVLLVEQLGLHGLHGQAAVVSVVQTFCL